MSDEIPLKPSDPDEEPETQRRMAAPRPALNYRTPEPPEASPSHQVFRILGFTLLTIFGVILLGGILLFGTCMLLSRR
jgi:hypothetical protein